MGERAIAVTDCSAIPQIIVSLLESVAGRDKEEIIASWNGDTQIAVRNALCGLTERKNGIIGKLIRF